MSTQKEDVYEKIRTYIKNNFDATIIDICETIKVPFDIVMSLVKEGNFILQEKEGSNNMILIKCEGCRVKLLSRRYCKSCEKSIIKKDLQKCKRVNILQKIYKL